MIGTEIGLAIRGIGSILFIIGCCFYAKGKGYNGAWGLLGLLSLIGLLILVCMKDKHKVIAINVIKIAVAHRFFKVKVELP